MCGTRFLSALALTCTSLLAQVGGAAAEDTDAATLELGLAKGRDLYLAIDPDSARLSIRARGMELDAITASRVEIAWGTTSVTAGDPPVLGLPAIWRVLDEPATEWRRVVAPDALYEYDADSDGSTAPSPTPASPRPELYDVPTDSGWRLAIGSSARGLVPSGLAARIHRGWRRLIGSPVPPLPPTLLLVVDPEDARRVVHLFRPGTALLIGRGVAPAPSDAGTPTATNGGSADSSPE